MLARENARLESKRSCERRWRWSLRRLASADLDATVIAFLERYLNKPKIVAEHERADIRQSFARSFSDESDAVARGFCSRLPEWIAKAAADLPRRPAPI
jgi:hypothetical protein